MLYLYYEKHRATVQAWGALERPFGEVMDIEVTIGFHLFICPPCSFLSCVISLY